MRADDHKTTKRKLEGMLILRNWPLKQKCHRVKEITFTMMTISVNVSRRHDCYIPVSLKSMKQKQTKLGLIPLCSTLSCCLQYWHPISKCRSEYQLLCCQSKLPTNAPVKVAECHPVFMPLLLMWKI